MMEVVVTTGPADVSPMYGFVNMGVIEREPPTQMRRRQNTRLTEHNSECQYVAAV